MNFSEALELLKQGHKVSRSEWIKENIYLFMEDGRIKSMCPSAKYFQYDNEIILSDGWIVDGFDETMPFIEAIKKLSNNCHIRLNTWKNMFLKLDRNQEVICCFFEECPFIPTYKCFIAEDWVLID